MCPQYTTKRCRKCGEIKPLDQYQKRASANDGHAYQCKDCASAYEQARKIARREYANTRYRDNQQFREIAKQRVRQRYATNNHYRDATKQRVKRWQNIYRERVNEQARRRYDPQKERYRKAKMLADPVKRHRHVLLRRRQWHKRRILKQAAGDFTPQEWLEMCARHNHRCAACGEKKPLTVDHVVPLSKGGTNTIDNLQPLCLPCNLRKATKSTDYRKLRQLRMSLD